MRCEVCGRKIRENPMRVVIEGAKLTVCVECSKHGKVSWEDKPKPKPNLSIQPSVGINYSPIQAPIQIKKRNLQARVDTSKELVDDYADVIKQAREKMGLSTEELGKKINERESFLKKIENGKTAPTELLISKLEHFLKITLLVPVPEEKTAQATARATERELTLGDL
ncbi:MAG: TIGR00270 family protein, partial [Crenarchaeota archaeon]|nr:TIGR00270 family protein [Thermoproteota archaeon]